MMMHKYHWVLCSYCNLYNATSLRYFFVFSTKNLQKMIMKACVYTRLVNGVTELFNFCLVGILSYELHSFKHEGPLKLLLAHPPLTLGSLLDTTWWDCARAAEPSTLFILVKNKIMK